jgi:hypothetical protein
MILCGWILHFSAWERSKVFKKGSSADQSKPLAHAIIDSLEKMTGRQSAPSDFTELAAQNEVAVQINAFHVFENMFTEVEECNPTVVFYHLIEPFFVVAIVAKVKIQNILSDKDEAVDAFCNEHVNDLPFQLHDIIEEAVVPFSNEFYNGKPFIVISE